MKHIKLRPAPLDDPIYTGGLVIGGVPITIARSDLQWIEGYHDDSYPAKSFFPADEPISQSGIMVGGRRVKKQNDN